jgi:hypothetical protein
MDRWIDDPISSRLDREYGYAEQRMAANAASGSWERAERWAQYAAALARAAQDVCFDEDRAEA